MADSQEQINQQATSAGFNQWLKSTKEAQLVPQQFVAPLGISKDYIGAGGQLYSSQGAYEYSTGSKFAPAGQVKIGGTEQAPLYALAGSPADQLRQTVPEGGTTTTQQSQDLSKVPTQGIGPDGKPIYDVFAGQEHIQDPSDPRLKGIDIAGLPTGQAPTFFKSKFEQGFNQYNAETGGKGEGSASIVNQYAPSKRNDLASAFVQQDEVIGSMIKAFQDFSSPQNQRKSLTETYQTMLKDSGIQALDTELLDMKKVIEGTEEDLRTEITKAGGFATESQIQALTNSRNKQLIKNYNQLIDLRNSKESYLKTAIGLEQADRQSADQRFESMFNMGAQIATMQQQMQTNSRNQMQWLASNMGFDGLYDATGGDPYYMSLVEQTLGLPQNGLAQAANQAKLQRTQAEQEKQLDLAFKAGQIDLQKSQLQTEISKRADISSQIESRRIQDALDMQKIAPENNVLNLATTQANVDSISQLIGDSYLRRAVGTNPLVRFSFLEPLTGGKSNFIAGIEQITSQLNLETLIQAKSRGATFGALSNQELQVLASAATKIGTWAIKDKQGKVTGYNTTPSKFQDELQKIQNFSKLDYLLKGGDPAQIGAQVIDGKVFVQNYDGSFTELP